MFELENVFGFGIDTLEKEYFKELEKKLVVFKRQKDDRFQPNFINDELKSQVSWFKPLISRTLFEVKNELIDFNYYLSKNIYIKL